MTDRPVALVTGASRGIGAAIALDLAAAGYDVAVAARTLDDASRPADHVAFLKNESDSTLGSVAAEIESQGVVALAVRMDLADLASVAAAADAVSDRFGRCDVLVNNAVYQGPGADSRFLDTSIEAFEVNVRANVVAPGVLVQRLVPGMIARGSGTVVNMSSFVVFNDPPGPVDTEGWSLSYAAGKAGLDRFAGILNQELAGTGVRVFNVEPGFVAYGPARDEMLAKYPGRPVTPPRAIGAAVRWLVSSPDADRLMAKRVHLPAITERLGLLPGWAGPGSAFRDDARVTPGQERTGRVVARGGTGPAAGDDVVQGLGA